MKTFCRRLPILIALLLPFGCTTERTVVAPPEDLRPPIVEWLSPVGGSTHGGVVQLILLAKDDSGIDSARLFVDGSSRPGYLFSAADSTLSLDWESRSFPDGAHLLEARVYDGAGNAASTPTLSIRLQNNPPPPDDRTPPRVEWLFPAAGSTVRDTLELRFSVADDSPIDSVKIYVDGETEAIIAGGEDSLYTYRWNTWRWSNGRRLVEVRAFDSSGNIGISELRGITIDNHRVIWVPDDYEKIQDAINASADGDTVRVRAGTYREGLRFMGKNIWLESEEGPERTLIDGDGRWSEGVWIADGENFRTTVIRGFTVAAYNHAVSFSHQSSALVTNCVLIGRVSEFETEGAWCGDGDGYISNCIIENCDYGIVFGYVRGQIFNTIIINCEIGVYKLATLGVWFENGWNLFSNNDQDYLYHEPTESDVFADPGFIPGTYVLSPHSPAINAGKVDIRDSDGSRSDIGVYGGPFAYK